MKTRLNGATLSYLSKPGVTRQAFLEGARQMLGVMELLPESERNFAVSVKNEQHILSLLLRGEELVNERRRQDVRSLLKACNYDRHRLTAFLFDVPMIGYNGCAVLKNGTSLENKQLEPRSDIINPGWTPYRICHYQSDVQISREDYSKLSFDRRSDYDYRRFIELDMSGAKVPINSSDRIIMEELIKIVIAFGDNNINRRFQKALNATMFYDDREEVWFDELKFPLTQYADVISEALDKVEHRRGGQSNLYDSDPAECENE